MKRINKINASLSVAAAMLLEACGSSGTESGPASVPNTTAPQLLATWETNCIVTDGSGSVSTVTSASGGGGGSISGGEAFRNSVIFNQDGRVEFITAYYATSNCNASTLAALNRYSAVYVVGEAGIANDGSPVTGLDIKDAEKTTYSIFQVTSGAELYLGETAASTAGHDGSSESARHDGLGLRMLKL